MGFPVGRTSVGTTAASGSSGLLCLQLEAWPWISGPMTQSVLPLRARAPSTSSLLAAQLSSPRIWLFWDTAQPRSPDEAPCPFGLLFVLVFPVQRHCEQAGWRCCLLPVAAHPPVHGSWVGQGPASPSVLSTFGRAPRCAAPGRFLLWCCAAVFGQRVPCVPRQCNGSPIAAAVSTGALVACSSVRPAGVAVLHCCGAVLPCIFMSDVSPGRALGARASLLHTCRSWASGVVRSQRCHPCCVRLGMHHSCAVPADLQ